MGDEGLFYPKKASLTDGQLTDRQLEEELDRGRVYRLNDRFFKFLFGREDRKTLFLDLVNALVFPDGAAGFTGFEYANRELSATRDEGKTCSLDIVAVMADGSRVEVEVQVKNRNDHVPRSVYYLTALHTSQMNAGVPYSDLKSTISIHLLAFSLFSGKRFRRTFRLCDTETGETLCDDLTLLYLEIPKYAKNRDPRSRLEYWLLYLAGMEAKKMPEAMVKDPMIGQALDLEKLFLQSQMERYNYLLSYKAMWDAETNDEAIRRAALARGEAKGRAEGEAKGRAEGEAKGRAEGEAKGRAEGRAEGEAKGIASTARRMLDMNFTSEQIAQATGLSLDEIEALRDGRP